MYGIAELIEYPNSEDPKLQRIELFDSLEEGLEATEKNMFAFATNDEVIWRTYITKIKE